MQASSLNPGLRATWYILLVFASVACLLTGIAVIRPAPIAPLVELQPVARTTAIPRTIAKKAHRLISLINVP